MIKLTPEDIAINRRIAERLGTWKFGDFTQSAYDHARSEKVRAEVHQLIKQLYWISPTTTYPGEFIPIKPPVSEVEQAAEKYIEGRFVDRSHKGISKTLYEAFIAGAKWQKERAK